MQLHCGLSAAAPYANCASKIHYSAVDISAVELKKTRVFITPS
jgi:hypothetical protein